MTEAETRALMIDQQLAQAGWPVSDRTMVGLEIPVTRDSNDLGDILADYQIQRGTGFTDYCLYTPGGEVLAVVEAKRSSREPREGEEQLRLYVDNISRNQGFSPYGFMANGLLTWFWEVGLAHPRLVPGFFTREDLIRLLFILQNGLPLASAEINPGIVNRIYQHEAVRRVCEAFSKGLRFALLVMATGTGKTRTIMALIDLFLRTRQAQRILFVADRDALVEQALTDGFKTFLPDEPRCRIHTARIDKDKRLYVATLQTLSRCFEKFSPGFFDMIIFDEAHRSIFNRFTEVIEYFDARMIGLTATPAQFIDRDTFRVFRCQNSQPTFLYPYEDAVKERYLVDFTVHQAQTAFQRGGIHGASLTEEERNALIAQGHDPDDIDYSGTDLEVLVTNRDTVRRQWEEIMEACVKDRSGQLPCKTIIFAMTQRHAKRIREVFEEMYPQFVGMLQVIYHGIERVHDGPWGRGLIGKFKHEDKPRFAVSVDMLDTGVDVPEVVNLVFLRPVQSRIKLWQMIGRGTRSQEACNYPERLPQEGEKSFLIIDFWNNDFGRRVDRPQPADVPVLVALFNLRLGLLETSLADRTGPIHPQSIQDLRAMIGRIRQDSFPIRKVWQDVQAAWNDDLWRRITPAAVSFLRQQVAPLMRFVADVDVAAETFACKIERLKLQTLRRQVDPDLLATIADDVSRLPSDVHATSAKQPSIRLALATGLASATPAQLTQVIADLADDMRRRVARPNPFRRLDLPDLIASRGQILIGPGGQPIYVEEYRRRVEARILSLLEDHPAMLAIAEDREPAAADLVALERILHERLSTPDLEISESTIRKAYGMSLDETSGFLGVVRAVLAIDQLPDYAGVVERVFSSHIAAQGYGADQIRFLRAVQEVFLQKHRLEPADLYDPPLNQFGRNAVDRLFRPDEQQAILALTDTLVA